MSQEAAVQGLTIKNITLEEYADFTRYLDIVPLAGPGLYERMKDKGDDVRIFGGYENDTLKIAMICRLVPAMKRYAWLEAPFGWVSRTYNDYSTISRFLEGVKQLCEEADNVLYLKAQSFIEYQSRDKQGHRDGRFSNQDYRDKLQELSLIPDELTKDFQPGSQSRFSAILNLAADENIYNGLPADPVYLDYPGAKMKTEEELLAAMDGKTQEAIAESLHDYYKVQILDQDQLGVLENFSCAMQEPFDPTYAREFGDACAVVYVALDIPKYCQHIQDIYDQKVSEVEQAFEAARQENSAQAQQTLQAKIAAAQAMDPDMHRIDSLKESGQSELPLAAGLYLLSPAETLCIWSAVNPDVDYVNGLYPMHWQMIRYSRQRRALRYTLWGLQKEFAPHSPGYSRFLMDQGLGCRVAEYCGSFTDIYKPMPARLYQTWLKSKS